MNRGDSRINPADAEHPNKDVAAWLDKAIGDLGVAEREAAHGERGSADAVCFHAQQAIEKLFKAVLVARDIKPPRIHDLVALDSMVQQHIPGWSWNVEQLSQLSAAAVETRYPMFAANHADANRLLGAAFDLWNCAAPQSLTDASPMRILHISTRLILGGSQENTVLSCEGQAVRGHEVHLAFGPIYGPEGSLLARVQKFRTHGGRGITTHVIPHLLREVNPLADLRASRKLRSLIGTLKPDIVHTHSSKAGILGRAAAWNEEQLRARLAPYHESVHNEPRPLDHIGVVHTIHGPPFMPVEGSALQRAKVRLNNAIYTRAERFAAKRCHTIVSVADAMTTQFLARGIGKPEQYITVRSGMEIEPFLTPRTGESRDDMRKQLGFTPEDFVIGTVARLAQHKGHDDLLEALAEDLKRAESPRMKLLWIGDGWWRERLIHKARTLGLTTLELDRPSYSSAPLHPRSPAPASPHPHILLTGLVTPDRIPALIRAMDTLAHPSYREGLPRTVPQALLTGVCPVAYDVDGTGEICRDMHTGRLVPLGDHNKLREAILYLRDHPQERADMARRGREECRTTFSAETMCDELEKVYAQALERARGVYEPRTK